MTSFTALDKFALIDPNTWLAGVPHPLFDAMRQQEPISWNEPESVFVNQILSLPVRHA